MEGLFVVKENNNTCKQCKHAQRWKSYEYEKAFFYCGVRYSGRTANKLLKIKLKNKACGMFEKELSSNT